MNGELTITLNNDISELDSLHEHLEEFGIINNLDKNVMFPINLALDELITNSISYGFHDDKEHIIQITVSLKNDELVALVEDDGIPFNPLESPEPDINVPAEERKIGGLGIHLVRKLTDGIRYARKGNKNYVTIIKKIRR